MRATSATAHNAERAALRARGPSVRANPATRELWLWPLPTFSEPRLPGQSSTSNHSTSLLGLLSTEQIKTQPMQVYKLSGNATIFKLRKILNSYKEPRTNPEMLLDCPKAWICGYKPPTVSFYQLSGVLTPRLATLREQSRVAPGRAPAASPSGRQQHRSRKRRARQPGFPRRA